MSQSIAPPINLKNSGEKLLFRLFSFFLLGQSLVLKTTAKINYVYWHLFARIAGFTGQWTAFTHEQGATLNAGKRIPYPGVISLRKGYHRRSSGE